MNKHNTYRNLDLYEIGDRCRACKCAEDIKNAMAPMLKGGCPHYLIVGKEDHWFLLYAGVSPRMNLELIIEKMNLVKRYKAGALLLIDVGLNTRQVLQLVGAGYGITLAVSDEETNILVLPREDDLPSAVTRKAMYTVTQSRWPLT